MTFSTLAPTRRQRRFHSAEFKASAVSLYMQSGVSITSVARKLDLNANLLGHWVSRHVAGLNTIDQRNCVAEPTFVPVRGKRPANLQLTGAPAYAGCQR